MMKASKRFDAYTKRVVLALGHADRETPFHQYTTGLLLPLERKSIEPIAARVDPTQVSATHQSLHHFVAKSDCSDRALLAAVQTQLMPVIALDQIKRAVADRVPPGVVLADAGYSADMKFQAGLLDLDLPHILGVQPNSSVWPDNEGPLPAKAWSGQGRPPTRLQRSNDHQPVSAKNLALSPPASASREVTWRAGVKSDLVSRFAAKRCLRQAHCDYALDEPWPELWLLIDWPKDEREPSKFRIANLPADAEPDDLVRLAKLRWRIERDYLELKQELGLGHYEGRVWRGFHHHASLCIAAYGFLMAERLVSSHERGGTKLRLRPPTRPKSFRPRGTPHQTRTLYRPSRCHQAMAYRPLTRPKTLMMSLLPRTIIHRQLIQFRRQ